MQSQKSLTPNIWEKTLDRRTVFDATAYHRSVPITLSFSMQLRPFLTVQINRERGEQQTLTQYLSDLFTQVLHGANLCQYVYKLQDLFIYMIRTNSYVAILAAGKINCTLTLTECEYFYTLLLKYTAVDGGQGCRSGDGSEGYLPPFPYPLQMDC